MLAQFAPDKFSVYVSNIETAKAFYSEILGFPILWDRPDLANAGYRAGNNIIITQQNPERVSPGGFRPHFTVDNLEELHAKLTAAGIECTDIQDFDSFTHLAFSDPDGNFIGLLQPKEDYIPRFESYLGRKLWEKLGVTE